MGIFGKKKSIVPEWASFFSEKEYDAFVKAIDLYFREKLKLSYELREGAIFVPENEFGFQKLGLGNLAQICRQNNVSEYPVIVNAHFDSTVESHRFQNEFNKIEKDYDQIEPYLAVRLYDTEYLSSIGTDGVVGKPFSGELHAVLVFDFPHSVINVQPEQILHWGKTKEALMETGLSNVRKNYGIHVEAVELGPEKDRIYLCESNHFFTGNILFDLDSRDGFVGKYGALTAAPNRSTALVYPIEDSRMIQVLNQLFGVVLGIYNDHPGSLSREIYWYHNQQFIPLPYSIENRKVQFYPPDAFIKLLNTLAGADNS
jgi:hypothetical protein